MAPEELVREGGSVDYHHHNERPGIAYLQDLEDAVRRVAWLNPRAPRWWSTWSTRRIRQLFPMFPLTMEGLEEAVETLRRAEP